MTTINIKDSLRQSVEAASGGRQTVLFTPKGQASFFTIFNKIDLSTLNPDLSGTHPAFIINGNEVDRILIGTYQPQVIDGEIVSQPWAFPSWGGNYATYRNAVAQTGKGYHLMTLPEWGLVAAMDNLGVATLGNNSQGSSANDSSLKGEIIPGQSNSIYSGSGPAEFRLNREYNQVSDLVGNRFQLCDGVRFVDGEIQITPNNDAAQQNYDLSLKSANWRAISGISGELLSPTGAGTINSDYKASTQNAIRLSSDSDNSNYGIYNLQYQIPNLVGNSKVQTTALNFLRAMGIVSISATSSPRGGFNMSYPSDNLTNKDCRWYRSGSPNHGGYASINSLFGGNYNDDNSSFVAEGGGVRLCYYDA